MIAKWPVVFVVLPVLVCCLDTNSNELDSFDSTSSLIGFLLKLSRVDSQDGLSSPSYIASVKLGGNQKQFRLKLELDTSEIWLPKYRHWWNLRWENNLNYANGYDSEQSQSSTCCSGELQFRYKQSDFEGIQFEDVLTISSGFATDTNASQLKMVQKFLAITGVSDGRFKSDTFDGVLGLGPSDSSTIGTPNILIAVRDELLKQDPDRDLPLTAGLWVGRDPDGAELTLLDYDHSRITGMICKHSLSQDNEPRRWKIDIGRVELADSRLVVSCENGCYAVFDVSVGGLLAPQENIGQLRASLGARYTANGRWAIDCDKIDTLPGLLFHIDGNTYKLDAPNYTTRVNNNSSGQAASCYLAIDSWSEPGWALGTGFMQAYYTIYDLDQQQVGIALLKL